MAYEKYKVNIPEGQSGPWSIEKFTVSKSDAEFDRIRAMVSGRYVPEGTYTKLSRGRCVIMSDTPDEIRDHIGPIYEAEHAGGNVLINGLGLGMVTSAILKFEKVDKVTVVEKSEDVISLVAPHIAHPKLEVVNADAFEYKPPKGIRYSVVWHDIWDNLCADNLPEMSKLHRKYGRRCDWQGSWGKEYIKRQMRVRGW